MSFRSPRQVIPLSLKKIAQPHRLPPALRFPLGMVLGLFLLISLACSLPGIGRQVGGTPSPTPQASPASVFPTPIEPTSTPRPLPPALVESDPAPQSEVSLDGAITLYFNQPMDRKSVEASFRGIPGTFTWVDDSTLVFTPQESFAPDTEVNLTLDTLVRASNGLLLAEPISLTYQTVGYLQLSQRLPEPETQSVDPSSAIVAAFNRPVVPLGADPVSLPPAFDLEPVAQGRGEWLNTSTYIFYPEPALAGGVEYRVQVDEDLQGVDGSPLQAAESWTFTTQEPALLDFQPQDRASNVRLDEPVVLTFNQPMDPESVEANFELAESDGIPVSGEFLWNEDLTVLTFQPAGLLKRDRLYTLTLGEQTLSGGGTPLETGERLNFQTVPDLEVISSQPAEGDPLNVYGSVIVRFNAPVQPKDVLQFITFVPQVPNLQAYVDEVERALTLYGSFSPETDYTLILSPNLPDEWNGRLGEEYVVPFRTTPLDPGLYVTTGNDVIFLTPEESSLNLQAVNVEQLSMTLGRLPLEDFQAMLAQGGYDLRLAYSLEDGETTQLALDVPRNQATTVTLPLSLDGQPLEPGLYFLRFNQLGPNMYAGPYLLVVSNVNLTLKKSAIDALVWAVDLRDGRAIADAPVTLYAESGEEIVSGRTGAQGLYRSGFEPRKDSYGLVYAILGQPGQEDFGAGLSYWSQGLDIYNFGYQADYNPPHLQAYLYTDRPVYRPGQTVYFRAIVRQAYNGRYTLPEQSSFELGLFNEIGEPVTTFHLPLSAFGTAHGSYDLPDDIAPGAFNLTSEAANYSSVSFQVAEYRKPEIDLGVTFASEQSLAGEPLQAGVDARYFFDAPAGNVPLTWALFRTRSDFHLPGYQVGKLDLDWFSPFPGLNIPVFGEQVAQGEGETDPQGKFQLELPTDPADVRYTYTLEITAIDESGLPVSARSSTQVNPAQFYIGVRPDAWVGRAGEEFGFEVLVVDWGQEPTGERSLRGEFRKVTWERVDPETSTPFDFPRFEPSYTPVGSTDFVTGPDGKARLAFTAQEPGTYQLDVSGLQPGEQDALTQALLWISGPGEAIWPDLPNQALRLSADKESYQPGETAQVFIPNPLGQGTQALVSLERGVVMRDQVIDLQGNGTTLSVPLGEEDAPNVFVAVTLFKPQDGELADFRQGYLILPVAPTELALNVTVTGEPSRTIPGGDVDLSLQVTDAAGAPVEGEFSLSVVDKAVLALADPNSQDILPAFYDTQPLGVQTSLSLAASTRRQLFNPGGMGGGGGDLALPIQVRELFQDTAFWTAELATDADGRAEVTVPLPDNLTTWEVDVRGVTSDTRVGQDKAELVTTKDLLVRPVTPRFLVQGDHALLAAVVQNNTQVELQVDVALQAAGFTLDDPDQAIQQVSLPAGGRARLHWWGTAGDVESVDLVFSADAGAYQDAARPELGPLPVRHYTAPQTFGTSGLLEEDGELLELVSLPRSFDPQGGALDIELAPSLGAAMLKALDVLEYQPYDCNEQAVSRFLPNLETYQIMRDFGIQDPALESRLERTLEDSLGQLLARQNEDGGWGWCASSPSDGYITAYVLFGLTRASQAGSSVDEEVIQAAVDYLHAALPAVEMLDETWELDRLAFEQFALAQAGAGDLGGVSALYEVRERINPWAQALLALTLEGLSPDDERIQTLVSELETDALRSATGAHWENQQPGWQNMSTTLQSTAVVLYALAQHDPASPLVADALRYLMAHREASGGWASTYETAWTLLALAETMKGTGELSGDFAFAAGLNYAPLLDGQAGATAQLNPVTASVPVADLYPNDPNALVIGRGAGPGRLYYNAHLTVNRPVEEVAPLDQGIGVSRAYYRSEQDCSVECEPIQGAQAGQLVTVRLTLTLPETAYYLMVEDYIPAGSEVLDTSLKTSQQGAEPAYDPSRPYEQGWGWWEFGAPQVYDDHIAWTAESLPPGTYELVYQLVNGQPGEYQVLPARAWQFYFPEVQGNSAGQLFEIGE
ncbi:MAG TPA: Ig-like domain-containing protein [Anaerolineales bacterium]|nr:Ig-like domain-containing protein [Anaerolineales bacterium]